MVRALNAEQALGGEVDVLLGATARRGAILSAEIEVAGSAGVVTPAVVAPLQADSTSVTVTAQRPLTTQDKLRVFTHHSHPLQTAGAAECIAEHLQQVSRRSVLLVLGLVGCV